MKILHTYTPQDLQNLEELMQELAPTAHCTQEQLMRVLNDPNAYLYVARDDERIVGCATLCVMHTIEQTIGAVEAVVVHSDYRGQHIGQQLMEQLMTDARAMDIDVLHLTSNPTRIAANGLYQALGFRRRETNNYVIELSKQI